MNRSLFSRASQEWECCRHAIGIEVYQREKIYCPPGGKTQQISGSSDANMKCTHLKSAGSVRKPENEREMYFAVFIETIFKTTEPGFLRSRRRVRLSRRSRNPW